jgi:hypothetical protein
MFALPHIKMTDAVLADRLRTADTRVYFVDAESGAPLGYFVPPGAVDHGQYDLYPLLCVTAQQQADHGGFTEIAECWSMDDEVRFGLFIPETERDRENYARFVRERGGFFGTIRPEELSGSSVEEMMHRLEQRQPSAV